MLRRLGVLIVCASVVAAGCIGSPGSADRHRETADEEAQRFAGPDAALVSVIGLEGNETIRQEAEGEGPYVAALQLVDDELGDGQAPAWVYSYRTGNATYRVAVDEDGTVIANETDDDVDEDQQPVDGWSVSSREAAEIAADETEAWTTGGEGFGVYMLSREAPIDDPTWKLGQLTQARFVSAVVNANTGELLGAETRDGPRNISAGPFFGPGGEEGPPEEPQQEGGAFTGTLTAAEPTAEHAFAIEEEGHRELGVRLALQTQAAGSSVNATIEGPNGTVGSIELSGETVERIEDWAQAGPGDYTITVELTDGVSGEYELDWCASGQPSGDGEIDEPCRRVSEGTQPGLPAATMPAPVP